MSNDGGQTLVSIIRLRNAIRYHRDQKGDDRCWLDDFLVWSLLKDSTGDLTALPTMEEGMNQCRDYYHHRRADIADRTPVDAILDRNTWDSDLEGMSSDKLDRVLQRLENAVRAHRDVKDRKRTLDDDRDLYAVLPEKVPADFRLPEEAAFLGEKKTDAGCPAFWKSHQACPCKEHNLHTWGPCC